MQPDEPTQTPITSNEQTPVTPEVANNPNTEISPSINKKEHIFRHNKLKGITGVVVVLVVAVLGVRLLLSSHAQAPWIAIEANLGTLTQPATVQSSSTASDGEYVQAGSSSTSNGAANMTPPAGYTASELEFQDNFTGTSLNTNNWNTYITSLSANGGPWDWNNIKTASGTLLTGGSSEDDPYGGTLDYCMPSQVTVNNGLNLTLEASSVVPGFSAVTGCVSSYNHFELSSGYIQFKVKFPDTSAGGFPAIWFLPGPGGEGSSTGGCQNRGEIDLQEGGDLPGQFGFAHTVSPNDIMATHYFPLTASGCKDTGGAVGGGYNTGVNLSSGYNIYGLQYTPGVSIKAYFNGTLVQTFTSNINTDPYEIIMNNSEVASSESSWHSTGPEPYPQVMSIAQVQAYK
jgi:hypothetical protein